VIRVLSDENVHIDIISGRRQEGIELVRAMEAGLCGQKDLKILEYAEEHDLLILSGDKDFGGLIEFGNLWGKGRVLLLRYQVLDCVKIVKDIVHVLLGAGRSRCDCALGTRLPGSEAQLMNALSQHSLS